MKTKIIAGIVAVGMAAIGVAYAATTPTNLPSFTVGDSYEATVYAPNGSIVYEGAVRSHNYKDGMVWITFTDGMVYGADTVNVIFNH